MRRMARRLITTTHSYVGVWIHRISRFLYKMFQPYTLAIVRAHSEFVKSLLNLYRYMNAAYAEKTVYSLHIYIGTYCVTALYVLMCFSISNDMEYTQGFFIKCTKCLLYRHI